MNLKIDKKIMVVGIVLAIILIMLIGGMIINWISNLLLIVRIVIFVYDAFRVGGIVYKWRKGAK